MFIFNPVTMETRQQQELKTLLVELNTVRKNAKVYKQLPNSNICFLSDVSSLKSEVQKKLEELQVKEQDVKPLI